MNTLTIQVFLKPARDTTPHGSTPRLEATQKAAQACEPQGAVLADLIRITGFSKAILTTTVGQYVKRGYLFKAGPLMRQRYYVSEAARDAGAVFIERDEEARKLEKRRSAQSGKERARQALLANVQRQDQIAKDKVERFYSAVVQTGSDGISTGELESVFNVTRRATQRPMAKLRDAGRVWFVSVGRTFRYYSTPEFAAAGALAIEAESKAISEALYKARQEKKYAKWRALTAKRQAERTPKPPKAKKVREASAKPSKAKKPRQQRPLVLPKAKPVKADPFKTATPIIPESVKVQVCPSFQDPRFVVTGPVIGGFATMRPGHYLPGESWATRALEAA